MSTTSSLSLEERVAALESEVNRLKLKLDSSNATQDGWKAMYGIFANDPDFQEVTRIGRQWRESFRPKPRKRSRVRGSRKRKSTR